MYDLLITFAIHLHIMIFVYSVWLHRGYNHGLLEFHPAVDHVCRFLMWTIGWGTFPEWLRIASGTHRYHHKNSDTEKDPHSPWTVSFKGLFIDERYNDFYKKHTHQELGDLAKDVPVFNDWMQIYIYNTNLKFALGLLVPIFFYTIFFGWLGLILGLLWMFLLKTFLLVFIAIWVVHKWGYQHPHYQFPDKSVNIFPIGIFFVGGELHSNHHANTMAINDKVRWFEFDIGYYYIKILEKLRLCKIRYHIVVPHSSLHK